MRDGGGEGGIFRLATAISFQVANQTGRFVQLYCFPATFIKWPDSKFPCLPTEREGAGTVSGIEGMDGAGGDFLTERIAYFETAQQSKKPTSFWINGAGINRTYMQVVLK